MTTMTKDDELTADELTRLRQLLKQQESGAEISAADVENPHRRTEKYSISMSAYDLNYIRYASWKLDRDIADIVHEALEEHREHHNAEIQWVYKKK